VPAVRGRGWMVVGVAAGLALALGRAPYLAGAARSLAGSAESLVGSGGHRLLAGATRRGAPAQAVEILTAVVAVVVPGVTALLAVLAARGTLRLRAVIALVLAGLGAATYLYQGRGDASGALILALAVGGIAVTAAGPLVVTPLCALAGLLCGETLPELLRAGRTGAGLTAQPASLVHQALYGSPGSPLWIRVALLIVAAVPFGVGARLVLWR
jgi:hypothetical protein